MVRGVGCSRPELGTVLCEDSGTVICAAGELVDTELDKDRERERIGEVMGLCVWEQYRL